ncbi:hypothetical protein [Rubritalea tangerina]|uniref:hypothetical protein n=1 Tax=Rubritalea tangerina TaxID=430798 RepID=UPI00360C9513
MLVRFYESGQVYSMRVACFFLYFSSLLSVVGFPSGAWNGQFWDRDEWHGLKRFFGVLK